MNNRSSSLRMFRHEVLLGALLLSALPFCGASHAATVTASQAKIAVQRWLSSDPVLGCPLRGDVADVRTYAPTNGASFHVARLSGGGFVVTSADTRRAPVVAFSSGSCLTEDESNPLWVLLRNDLAIRTQGESAGRGLRLMGAAASTVEVENEAKWARLLGGGGRLMASRDEGVASVSDVRVPPIVKSKWGQSTAGIVDCFNLYTPKNYSCGCVATVGAQIMRHFRYPVSSMPKYTNPLCEVDGRRQSLTTQGGTYAWDYMPLVPDTPWSEGQRRAIGKLTSDIGICCGTKYFDSKLYTASEAPGFMLAHAFTNHFGYANAMVARWAGDQSRSEALRRAILSNLDAGYPVSLSLDGRAGHDVIGDGYGYSDGKLYIHFNMGWNGTFDAWYAPPEMSNSKYNFNIISGIIYNIFPKQGAGAVICSGRVTDADGLPIENAVVSYREQGTSTGGGNTENSGRVLTNEKGIYALVLPAGRYLISASFGDSSASTSVVLAANVATRIDVPNGGYYANPAPQISNVCENDLVLTGVATVSAPQFRQQSCGFYPSMRVAIDSTASGATIRYTLDGSDPDESSTVYTGVFTVDDDTVVKARAWKGGMNPSAIVTATYTYDYKSITGGTPKGDSFYDPIVISGASGSRTIADNSDYTLDDSDYTEVSYTGERMPRHMLRDEWQSDGYCIFKYYDLFHTIWYKWTAPETGTFTFTTRLRNSDWLWYSFVAVYTGDSVDALDRNRIAFNDDQDNKDYYATVSFHADKGETYRIVGMSWVEEQTGSFTLSWSREQEKPSSWSVAFGAGGANGTPPAALSGTTGDLVVLPGCGSLAKSGYRFAGWSDGAITYTEGTEYQIAGGTDVTLVATWKRIADPYICGMPDPAGAGAVTGSGSCAEGKKVTLKATPNKGWVFLGWIGGPQDLHPYQKRLQPNAIGYVATAPSLVIDRTAKPAASSAKSATITDVADDVTYYAVFVKVDEDAAAVSLAVGGTTCAASQSGQGAVYGMATRIMCGVALEWPIEATALSATKVKVSGLPAGLKFTDKGVLKKGSKTVLAVPPNTIYGAPSAASSLDRNTGEAKPSTVKVSVTTAGKSSAVYQLSLTVDPLPAWAVGNFEGVAGARDDGTCRGTATMGVTSAGKVSGKIAMDGTNWTFKADSFAAGGTAGFKVAATATAGKETREIVLDLSSLGASSLPGSATALATGTFGSDEDLRLWRLPWADKGDTAPARLAATLAGAYSCRVRYGNAMGDVTFVLDEKGAVKGTAFLPDGASTRKASFAATALPMENDVRVAIVLPPDAKKGYPGVCETKKLVGRSGDPEDGVAYRAPGVIAGVASLYEGSGASGTVTVNPKYGQPGFGKKVTLTAKADKGSVFAGWYLGGTQLDATETSATNPDALVSQSASWSFEMPANDVPVTAKFVKAEEDQAAIKLTVDGVPLSRAPGATPAWSNYCGVAVSWPVFSCGLSETTVKASGLPSGLKLVQDKVTKAFSVTGVPTAASKPDKNTGILVPCKVKFTVTTAGKSSETFEIDVVVLPLPTWAVGTFDGYVKCVASADGHGDGSADGSTMTGGGWNTQTARHIGGIVSLSIAANGKIAGKLLEGGKTWTLGAASLDAVRGGSLATATDGGDLTFRATVIGKAGKETVTNMVTLSAGARDDMCIWQRGVLNALATRSSNATGEMPVGPVEWAAWQNLWKRSDTKTAQPTFKKAVVVNCPLGKDGDADSLVTLTFKKDGVVAFAGKVGGASVSGSSQLAWSGGYGMTALVDIWEVTLYAPPKGTFAGWCEILSVKLELDSAGVVTGAVVE